VLNEILGLHNKPKAAVHKLTGHKKKKKKKEEEEEEEEKEEEEEEKKKKNKAWEVSYLLKAALAFRAGGLVDGCAICCKLFK